MLLVHELLPHLKAQPQAHLLNMGSVFGNIGYPGYAAYSASKFAMRGFTEALRRELADTRVRVHYLAPRATRTPINSPAVQRMNAELKVAMDPPEAVARAARTVLGERRRRRGGRVAGEAVRAHQRDPAGRCRRRHREAAAGHQAATLRQKRAVEIPPADKPGHRGDSTV